MRVLKTVKVNANCYLQRGDITSWDARMPVVRLAYYLDNGKFSRSGSSELCISDLVLLTKFALQEGQLSDVEKEEIKALL